MWRGGSRMEHSEGVGRLLGLSAGWWAAGGRGQAHVNEKVPILAGKALFWCWVVVARGRQGRRRGEGGGHA